MQATENYEVVFGEPGQVSRKREVELLQFLLSLLNPKTDKKAA